MKSIFTIIIMFSFVTAAQADIVSRPVQYKHGKAVLEGYLAYDNTLKGKRPGVLVVHEWWGLNEYAKSRTEQLARAGYVAFAIDMYGKGVTTRDPAKAGALAGQFKGKSLMGKRALAGKKAFLKDAVKLVDPEKIAVLGFCFGGTTALELAYTGTDLRGAISFHGSLPVPSPEKYKNIKPGILVLHGADDPFVSNEQISKFQQSMRDAGLDWQMVYYGSAVHAFTNSGADRANIQGVAYNKIAAKRSWTSMLLFLKEIFSDR